MQKPPNALDPALTGEGIVSSTDGAISCGNLCSAFAGGPVVLDVSVEPRSAFHSWDATPACTETAASPSCTLAMNQDTLVRAHFVTNGANLWAKQLTNQGNEVITAVALDGSNNLLVTGRFDDKGAFGGSNFVATAGDVFVAKYDSRGNHLVSRAFGSSQDEYGLAIAVDPQGNVIVGGQHKGQIDLPPVSIPFGGADTVWFDGYVLKLDAALEPKWGVTFTAAANELVTGVLADAQANVFVAVYHWAHLTQPASQPTSGNSADISIAKFDQHGGSTWIGSFADDANQGWPSIALDAAGNLYLSGFSATSSGGVAWSRGGCAPIVSSAPIPFILKVEPDGKCLWSRAAATADIGGEVYALEVSSDAIYLGGAFFGQLDFDGAGNDPSALLQSGSDSDGFVVRLGLDGSWQPGTSWARRIGDTGGGHSQIVVGLGADASGDVAVVARVAGPVDAGGGTTPGFGSTDILVAKYGADGAHRWSHRYGTAAEDEPAAIACESLGSCVIAGRHGTSGWLDFGGIAPNPLATPVGYDAFVAKLAP